MRISRSLLLLATLAAAGATAATSAGAAERMSDDAYLTASRCAGLIQGGKGDAGALKARLEDDRGSHDRYIQMIAEERRDEALRQAQHARGVVAQRIAAEMDGACKAFGGAPQIAAR